MKWYKLMIWTKNLGLMYSILFFMFLSHFYLQVIIKLSRTVKRWNVFVCMDDVGWREIQKIKANIKNNPYIEVVYM